MSGEMRQMQSAIINYIKSRTTQNKSTTGAVQGKYYNGKVIIGNKRYSADLAVDMAIEDGDTVWCVLSDDGTMAVIVGM